MAAVKANNKRRMAAAAADLPDDMIIEIIRRLPLKYAARCRILNKYFYNTISTPRFLLDHHALLSPPSSNSIVLHHSHTKFTRIYSKSITLPTNHGQGLRIVDSCNGVFLLFSRDTESYSVFNPFTGAVAFLNYKINRLYCGTLVVDINPPSDSSSPYNFKLVELQTKTTLERGVCPPGVLRFRVIVPVSTLLVEEVRLDYESSFDPLMEQDRRPVYAHGCVHWLGVGATAIAAFDVGSVRARIMDGPVTHAVDCTNFRIWFGLAQGSLQFICTDDTDIIVHTHNYITQEWRVAHKIQIQKMMIPVGMKKIRVVPVFSDGQNVFVHVKNNKIEDINNLIYMHDLSSRGGVWRKGGQVEEVIEYDSRGKGWGHRYVEYVPTTARVSDFYLSKMPANPTLRVFCLHRLRRLLLA